MCHLRLGSSGAVAFVLVVGSGCHAYVEPDVGYATVTSAPVDIETYPSVSYEGRPVYFYGDRWWYRDGRRWTYYRDEPVQLHRERAHVRRVPRPRFRDREHERR